MNLNKAEFIEMALNFQGNVYSRILKSNNVLDTLKQEVMRTLNLPEPFPKTILEPLIKIKVRTAILATDVDRTNIYKTHTNPITSGEIVIPYAIYNREGILYWYCTRSGESIQGNRKKDYIVLENVKYVLVRNINKFIIKDNKSSNTMSVSIDYEENVSVCESAKLLKVPALATVEEDLVAKDIYDSTDAVSAARPDIQKVKEIKYTGLGTPSTRKTYSRPVLDDNSMF